MFMANESVRNAPASSDTRLRIAVEQIDALFGFVILGVCGAVFSAVILSLILLQLGVSDEKDRASLGLLYRCPMSRARERRFA
jgi:hypothetical protein